MGTAPATIVSLLNTIAPNNYTRWESPPRYRNLLQRWIRQQGDLQLVGTPTYTKTTFANPIQYQCQPNFVILMTDGSRTVGRRPHQATLQFTTDHNSTFPGIQN